MSAAIVKGDMGLFESFKLWGATDELNELWCVESDLIEKDHIQFVDSRGIDAGHEVV